MCLTKCAFSIFAVILVLLSLPATAVASVTTYTGTLPDGATFIIEVPSPWNGTLLLYSHGYVIPGAQDPAQDVGDPATGAFLLSNGFALAGSSYAHTGWAIQEALPDQIAVLDTLGALVGTPSRTIAWGHSLGGIITAGLIQRFPDRFDAALPMCGVLSGGVGFWNQALDSEFAFKTLLASGHLVATSQHHRPEHQSRIGGEPVGFGPSHAPGKSAVRTFSRARRYSGMVRSSLARARCEGLRHSRG